MKTFLTEIERSTILELRNSKQSINNIAKQIHRSKITVSKFLNNPENYIKEMEAYLAMPPDNRSTPKTENQVTLKKFLTPIEREKIETLRSEGKSVNYIASFIGRGCRTINTYLNDTNGYEELINKSKSEIRPIKKRPPTLLSNKDRLKVLQLKEIGLPLGKIAEKTRKSRETILTFLKNQNDYESFMTRLNSSQKSNLHSTINGLNNSINTGKPRMAIKRYLTEEERSKIIELRKENLSIKNVAKLIHRSIETVSTFLKNPDKYTAEVQQYESQKTSRQTIKSNTSYKYINEALSENTLKVFNKVSIEYRSVIKYLVKKGISPKLIFEDLREVYGSSAPDYEVVLYWVEQFQQGRQTIVNEAKLSKSPLSEEQDPNNGCIKIENGFGNNSGNIGVIKKPPVKLKLFQFKFKPLKRSN